jgi:protein-S-isoprenylcysteine O-methyltransferase Ste14
VPFKLAFAGAFLVALMTATRTARHATRVHGGSINQLPHEARGLIAIRSVLGIVFYSALVAWIGWDDEFAWSYLPIPTPVRWVAVALLVPVLAFFAWSFHSLGSNYRGGVGLYESHQLVTTGAYRVMRHPINVAFIAVMVLVLVLSANWVMGLSGLLLVGSIAAIRIPIEERELAARFGDEWERYRNRTGMVLPRSLRI